MAFLSFLPPFSPRRTAPQKIRKRLALEELEPRNLLAASPSSLAFGNLPFGAWSPAYTWVDVQVADVNGDGFDDVIGRSQQTGQWWAALSNGSTGFTNVLLTTWNPQVSWVDVHAADFFGNGMAEIVGRDPGTGEWWMAVSNGKTANNLPLTQWSNAVTWTDVNVADLNGDGKADLVGRVAQTGQWWATVSTPAGWQTSLWDAWSPNVPWVDVKVGDLTGNGKADLIGRDAQTGQWFAALSTGSSFRTTVWGAWSPAVTWVDVNLADVNGDGKADLVGRVQQSGQWWVTTSDGKAATNTLWTTWSPSVTWVDVQVADFNGDGLADLAGRALNGGQWWVGSSTGSSFANKLWTTWSPTATWSNVHAARVKGTTESDLVGMVAGSNQWWVAQPIPVGTIAVSSGPVDVSSSIVGTHPVPVPEGEPGTRTVSDATTHVNNEFEEEIGVDPTNPQNLFVASNQDSSSSGAGLFAAYSTNGGATWTGRIMADGTDGLPQACCDPSVSWDSFGNLFVSYLDENAVTSGNGNAVLCLSTDGGKTFKVVMTWSSQDQPKVTTADGTVWEVWNNNNISADGAKVTGLGNVGAFIGVETVPNTTASDNFGNISIGPAGQVLVSYQGDSGGLGPDMISVALDPDGLGASGFSTPVVATQTNVGGFYPIPAQPARTIDTDGRVAYDDSNGPHRGRVYLDYVDTPSVGSNNSKLFVRFSDDDGATWSNPVQVSDDKGSNSEFWGRLSVDPTSGNVGLSWYDCRLDKGAGGPGDNDGIPNDEPIFFGTFSTDGGNTFAPSFQVGGGPSSAVANPNTMNDFGDYTGTTFLGGKLYSVWADNSNSTGTNPDGHYSGFDVYENTTEITSVVQFATASETVSASAGTFSITVQLSAAGNANVTVPFTVGGTAVLGTDYTGLTSSPLVIAAGQTTATISGVLLPSSSVNPTLVFTLGAPTGAILGPISVNILTITETPNIGPVSPPPPPPLPPILRGPPDDVFEPNDTSDTATNFGILTGGTQSYTGLTINGHLVDGFPVYDQDFYRWTVTASGTFTATLSNMVTDGGGIYQARILALMPDNSLLTLATSPLAAGDTQTISASVGAGQTIFLWVYGVAFRVGSYPVGSYDFGVTLQ